MAGSSERANIREPALGYDRRVLGLGLGLGFGFRGSEPIRFDSVGGSFPRGVCFQGGSNEFVQRFPSSFSLSVFPPHFQTLSRVVFYRSSLSSFFKSALATYACIIGDRYLVVVQ